MKNNSFFTFDNLKLLILSILGVYGLFWISIGAYYSYPNAEDLSLASLSRDSGIISGAINMLTTYDGRYTVNVLHGLNPLAFDYYYGYKLIPIVTFFLFAFSLFLLLNVTFRNKPKFENGLYALVFVILFFSVIDLAASLYWMICSIVYIYPFIFFTFFLYFFYKFSDSSKKIDFGFSLVFLFLAVGCCELHLPIFGILLLSLFYYFKNDVIRRNLIIRYIVVYLFSALLFITSPGITNRFNRFNNERSEAFETLFQSSFEYTIKTFQSLSFIPLLFFLLLFVINYIRFKEMKSNGLFLILAVGCLLIYSTWLFLIFLRGDSGYASRISSVPVFIAILTLIFTLSYFAKFFEFKRIQLLISILMLSSFFFYPGSYSYIQHDFKMGKLQVFKNKMDANYVKLTRFNKNSRQFHSVELDIIEEIPSSICIPYRYIISNREDDFLNASYEKFFKVDEVFLTGDTVRILNQFK